MCWVKLRARRGPREPAMRGVRGCTLSIAGDRERSMAKSIGPASRGSAGFRLLRAVLRAALLPPRHPRGVERPANDVIADARQVLHAAAPDEDDRVLLQVVSHARNVGRDLETVGQTHACNLRNAEFGFL